MAASINFRAPILKSSVNGSEIVLGFTNPISVFSSMWRAPLAELLWLGNHISAGHAFSFQSLQTPLSIITP
jgi:hypothetical protein